MVHLAFKHDLAFSGDFAGAAGADRRAVETFGDALQGTGKPFVLASGLLGLAPGGVASEADGHDPLDGGLVGDGPSARQATAEFTLRLADRGVRSSVVRLPPTVHGRGDTGFVASLVGLARAHGVAGYLGDGTSRWPAVHRDDAASLFRLAVESAPAGTTLHAAAEEGVPLGDVAAEIGRQLDLPVRAVPDAEATDHFLWLAPTPGAGHTGVECGDPPCLRLAADRPGTARGPGRRHLHRRAGLTVRGPSGTRKRTEPCPATGSHRVAGSRHRSRMHAPPSPG